MQKHCFEFWQVHMRTERWSNTLLENRWISNRQHRIQSDPIFGRAHRPDGRPHHRLTLAATDHAKRLLEIQVEQTDREIDALVYDLYGLTPDEIAVVEAAVAKKG
ncbi:MAG: hypothetical protein ABFC38_15130 [Methanospirillum sp.]